MPTASTSSVWITESIQGMQAAFGVVGAIVGGAFILASRIQSLEQTTSTTALFLGLLVLVVSLATLVIGGKQIISVDPRRRLVEIKTVSRFGTKRRLIAFSQVSDVSLGELGDKEGGSISYHVVLNLKDGKKVAIFVGAFEGICERHVMDGRRHRLNEYLQAQ
jgi:hypothetical protein